jgi:hypothetical protein
MEFEEMGVTPEAATQDPGVEVPAAEGNEEAVDIDAEFEEAIKDKYAAPFKKRMEGIVTGRVKNLKARNAAYEGLAQMAAARYGVDPNDLNAITQAFQNDKSYLQEQADNNGVTAEVQAQLNEFESYKARQKYEDVQRQMAQQVQETLAEFPEFDLDVEMSNPDFMNLIGAGVDVKKAYMTTHMDEIMGGAIQYAVGEAQRKTINDIQARGTRPLENGASSHATTSTKIDVNKLTSEQMDELEERARRGENITFT